MLTYTYDIPLLIASIAISLMASFTGLTITKGISALSVAKRKTAVGMGAIVIGSGIWSMHFVAILAMEFPISVAYDPRLTLASVLIAILLAGCALLLLHFAPRGTITMIAAGGLLGTGILSMHMIGMLGIRGCGVSLAVPQHLLAALLALGMGVLAIWAAYRARTRTNIFWGTLILGFSVVIVHFTAMLGTGFVRLPTGGALTPSIESGDLAMIVIIAAFMICGAFLLSAATFLVPQDHTTENQTDDSPDTETSEALPSESMVSDDGSVTALRLPYEQDRKTFFLPADHVAAIRAEGHYTILYAPEGKHFCPWSISDAEKRLHGQSFIRTHRSYLVNIDQVSGFERLKDNGRCLLHGIATLDAVPVSRARVDAVRNALGL